MNVIFIDKVMIDLAEIIWPLMGIYIVGWHAFKGESLEIV